MTVEEIKSLQRELGVTPDGIIGPETRAAAQAKLDEQAAQAEMFGEADTTVLQDPNLVAITETTGLIRGITTSTAQDDTSEVVVEEEDLTVETGDYPKTLYNKDGTPFEVNNAQEEELVRGQGFTLSEPPKGEGGKISTGGLEGLLGQYAQSAQVAEIAQTGPSTYEQAKGLYPYLDDRLIRLFLNKYAESGNERLALAEMRADPIMNDIYPGIKRTDGTLRMTEQEYVAAVDNMKATVRTYNLNPNEFQDDIVNAISGDVSPLEFRQRMEAGYEGVVNNIPQVKQAYLDNFGIDLPDESIFAMFVSPNVATKILEGNIRASQVLGEAEAAGFGGITGQVGTSLVQQGLTQEGARQGFGQASLTLKGIQGAAARQGRRGPTAVEYVEATQLGAAQELQNLQNITAQIASESAAVLGAARTQTGAVTGLEEA